MIDSARLNIHGGNGGKGCVSFYRSKYLPKGGPDGGMEVTGVRFLSVGILH